MRTAISALIDMLPPVRMPDIPFSRLLSQRGQQIVEMKRYLEQPLRSGRARPRLKDMSPSISEDAWLVLRWIVASCTAYLEELQSDGEKVKNMGMFCGTLSNTVTP